MTTIAYRDGVMAADSRGYSGDRQPIGSKVKIRRMTDGSLVGASTTVPGGGDWVLDWYARGCPATAGQSELLPDKFTLLAVERDGSGFYASDHPVVSGPLEAPFFAIGTGAELALGAMAAGASALEAVRIACRLDPWSDLPIYASHHEGPVLIVNEEE